MGSALDPGFLQIIKNDAAAERLEAEIDTAKAPKCPRNFRMAILVSREDQETAGSCAQDLAARSAVTARGIVPIIDLRI
jgi:hypothetical protein